MPVVLKTFSEALQFIDGFDGCGMISVDEQEQIERLREFDLIDDLSSGENTPPQVSAQEIADEECETFERKVQENLDALKSFAENELKTNSARFDEDFWEAFDDDTDVQFSVCDDDENENFERVEVWVYPITERGITKEKSTNTTNGILIGVYDQPLQQ